MYRECQRPTKTSLYFPANPTGHAHHRAGDRDHVDNLIFAIGAFGGVLPWDVVWEFFVFNLLVKYGVTLVSLPLIYIAPDRSESPDQ